MDHRGLDWHLGRNPVRHMLARRSQVLHIVQVAAQMKEVPIAYDL
jgi:hypothetical protein